MRTPFELMTIGVLLLCVMPVWAQSSGFPEPGDAGIFADPEGTVSTLRVEPFVAFDVYVVAFDLEGGLDAYEFSIMGYEPLYAVGGWQAGYTGCCGPMFPDFVALVPTCLDESGPVVLARVTFMAIDEVPVDQALCLRQTSPTSFPLEPGNADGPGLPGYLRCDSVLQPFGVAQNGGGVYPNGCLILNPTIEDAVVPNDAVNFGEVKARY